MNLTRLIPAFSLTFIVAYQLFDFFQISMFRYYPSIGRFSLTRLSAGNAIQWYGWMAYALVTAIAVTAVYALIPSRMTDRIRWDWAWGVPIATVLLALYIVVTGWWLT